MKAIYSFFILTLLIPIHGLSQSSILIGKVLDEKNQPLPGVNVFIKGSYDGTSTDSEGSFEFETTEKGNQLLVFKMMGFITIEQPVSLTVDRLEIPTLSLKEEYNELNTVTISAGALEASDEKKSVILRPLDIVTTPSAVGDIVGAFQTLPGTSTVGNDGRLFVRGGDASEVGIFIDGLRVGNAYGSTAGNVPTRTRFNPNLFKGTFFSTGGYSAEFGQALSSALALTTKDLAKRNQGDISIMSVGGGYSHTLANEKQSLTVSANLFDLKPYQALIQQNFDWERAPFGRDMEIAAQRKTSQGGLWKILARTESGGMKLWQDQPGQVGRGILMKLNNQYSYIQSNWRKGYENGWSLFGGISFSHNKDRIHLGPVDLNRKNQLIHAKWTAGYDFSDRLSVKNGLEYLRNEYSEALIQEKFERNFSENQAFFFSEWDWYLSRKLVLRAGVRTGYSSLANETWIDPRASLAFKLSENGTLSVAAGRFHQLPEERFRVLNPALENTSSKHLILNYLYQKEGKTFRAEAFHKSYDHLIRFEGSFQNPLNIQNGGEGFARGFDVFFRDRESIKNTDYWITYSFVDSKRSYFQYSNQVQPDFAPKHNLSVVVKHFIVPLKSQLGISWSFNDGLTFTDPNFSGEMNSKTNSFQNLSLSWSYLPRPNLIIHGAITNVTGHSNVFGYQFASTPNSSGTYESVPIGQPAPRFLFLGIFLTLSKDKNANQLNNL
ncbi:TonB-dependent receptor [Algoriphagus sanaruensis]|uniref:TonB-dependent receptor n=1 Tax=Algoriphagus sanaruensis TaxID=1727163 RepID=A0A142EJL7_9BACT|nr:TonB-dependent receptor [Algoriphagus sanaruensis]AMQ55322.1 TonB-dependent receptor [Algoriphagus sanaruensis]